MISGRLQAQLAAIGIVAGIVLSPVAPAIAGVVLIVTGGVLLSAMSRGVDEPSGALSERGIVVRERLIGVIGAIVAAAGILLIVTS
jgi:hypothetical protein